MCSSDLFPSHDTCRKFLTEGQYIPQYLGDTYKCGFSYTRIKGGNIIYVGRGAVAERSLDASQYGRVTSFSIPAMELNYIGTLLPPVDVMIAGALAQCSPRIGSVLTVKHPKLWKSYSLPRLGSRSMISYKEVLEAISGWWNQYDLASFSGAIFEPIQDYVVFWGPFVEDPEIQYARYEKLVNETKVLSE